MKKILFYLAIILIFNSCRTEDNSLDNKNPKETTNNQKILDEDLVYVIKSTYEKNSNQDKNMSEFFGNIEFRFSSDVIKYEDGRRVLIFPTIKENGVDGLVLAVVSSDDKKVNFSKLDILNKDIKEIKELFAARYNLIKDKLAKAIHFGTKKSEINGKIAGLPRCTDESGGGNGPGDDEDCRIIPGVIITKPGVIPSFPGPDIVLPVGPGPFPDGGPSIPNLSPADLEMLTPKDPIKDLNKFFECLDRSKPANLKIYADTEGIGHVFISISQGNNVSTFGYYPQNRSPHPKTVLGPGTLNNDGDHTYDTYYDAGRITPDQLKQILNLANEYHNRMYDLLINNCVHFGKDILNIIGKNNNGFPKPSVFSEKLKELGGKSQKGNGPNSNKSCNK